MVIIDRFQKACCLVPLTMLPKAKDTPETIFKEVFRYYGVSDDSASDQGMPFTSQFSKTFY